ncbi:MAG: hypothetical protein OHK0045_22940 [Raineya sp.]
MESINERLKHFRKNVLKLSQAAFSRKLNITQANISQVENGHQRPSQNFLENLVIAYPNLNMNWLQSGVGAVFLENNKMIANFYKDELRSEEVKGVTYLCLGDKRVLVELPYFPITATASLVEVFNDENSINYEKMYIPYLEEQDYRETIITQANGDSMEPTIKSASIIVAKKVDPSNWAYITGVCMVVFQNMRVIKRIKENDLIESNKLKLYSDNESHGSIVVNAEDIIAIFKVQYSINKV